MDNLLELGLGLQMDQCLVLGPSQMEVLQAHGLCQKMGPLEHSQVQKVKLVFGICWKMGLLVLGQEIKLLVP